MPALPVIINTDISIGLHTATPANGSRVFIENQLVTVVSDPYIPASHGIPPHPTIAAIGSSTVYAANLAVTRQTDALACGDVANNLPGRTVFSG